MTEIFRFAQKATFFIQTIAPQLKAQQLSVSVPTLNVIELNNFILWIATIQNNRPIIV